MTVFAVMLEREMTSFVDDYGSTAPNYTELVALYRNEEAAQSRVDFLNKEAERLEKDYGCDPEYYFVTVHHV